MRNPENVLISLTKHSNQKDYKYERLYRLLYNEELYLTAYQNIYSNDGSMTKGTDKQTVDGMSIERIRKIIVSLKDESYQPKPARRTYIPKKNGKMRPLGIPSFEDKLLQEVIRMILEAIYEGHFENTSHGFRPNRSCHTALNEIQKTFTGVKWFIEGDIKGFFDNINHATLIGILRERINDERFLRLVRKFLNAGYIENWTFHNTYSGTPQGGIISPILANIYLDKFDKYVNEYVRKFKKGKKRMRTKEYRRNEVELSKARIALKNANDDCERENAIARIRQLEKERVNIPPSDPMDNNYARLVYVRYADDWLCGVIGSKEDCKKIKEDFKNFLKEQLQLELSEEKTLITNAQKSAKFLSYEIRVRHSNLTKRDKTGKLVRNYTGTGVHLSGGERQRIAIARAIVKDAPIIVLDEATAFSDPENEYLIQKAFEKLIQNKTVVMIAHRLSTIRNADQILVMEKGHLIESGTHDELLKMGGKYAQMWSSYTESINWKISTGKAV